MGGASPLVADLDGDGFEEIVAGGASPQGEVMVYNHDGSHVASAPWTFPKDVQGHVGGGDLNNDGQIEAVFAEYEQGAFGRIHAVDIDGRELPGWPATFGQPVLVTAAITIFDFDGDGRLETLYTTAWIWGYNASGLTLLDDQGAPLPGWPVEIDETVESGFAIADLDLDGDMEIVTAGYVGAGQGEASIFAFNHDGTPFAAEPRLATLDAGVVGTPVSLANLDGGPEPEIVACDWAGHIHVFDNQGGAVNGWPPVANFGYVDAMPVALRSAPNEVSALWCNTNPSYVLLYHADGTLDSH
ncbi:MAG: hypothetical protein CME06_01765 [Gemmatimonadetes bacterium]|nr:hypothetical protein [Gemmatimonadota bacterium]